MSTFFVHLGIQKNSKSWVVDIYSYFVEIINKFAGEMVPEAESRKRSC